MATRGERASVARNDLAGLVDVSDETQDGRGEQGDRLGEVQQVEQFHARHHRRRIAEIGVQHRDVRSVGYLLAQVAGDNGT